MEVRLGLGVFAACLLHLFEGLEGELGEERLLVTKLSATALDSLTAGAECTSGIPVSVHFFLISLFLVLRTPPEKETSPLSVHQRLEINTEVAHNQQSAFSDWLLGV